MVGVGDQMLADVMERGGQVTVVAVDVAGLPDMMSNALVEFRLVGADLGEVVLAGGLEALGG